MAAQDFQEAWVLLLNEMMQTASNAARHKDAILTFKRFICGQAPANLAGAWKVLASSNAVDANGADNWQSVADIVPDIDGNVHSWILLQSPSQFLPEGSYMQLLIDCNQATTNSITVKQVTSADPYNASLGTTTDAPTAPLSEQATVSTVCANGTDPQRMHFWRTESGIFICGFSKDGDGFVARGAICLTGARAAVRDKTDNFCAGLMFLEDPGQGVFRTSVLGGNMKGVWTDGTTAMTFPLSVAYPFVEDIPAYVFDLDDGKSAITGNRIAFPADLYSMNTGKVAYRGRVPDIGLAPPSLAINQFLDDNGDAELRLQNVQQLWLPVANSEIVVL